MLWLAGLMGLMAVGAVTFVEPQPLEEDDEFVAPEAPADDDVAQGDLLSAPAPADNFEPDYDSRGGDDAAILDPVVPSDEDVVTLTDGTQDDDLFAGDQGNDRARGLDGDDTLLGGAGNDDLRGDDGDDTLAGDTGNDTLNGQDGSDLVRGGAQNDVLFGNNGSDALFGDDGHDALQGSAGNDIVDGGAGDDTLHGGLDNDTIIGGAGSDALFGGWGNDVLSGLMRDASTGNDTDSADFLNGGGGADSILVGAGDLVTAGSGADEIILGDWLAAGEAAQILDYAASDDSLVLVWDDSSSGADEPQIAVSIDPDSPDQTLVFMDGAVVAMVNGSNLLVSDIALIPLSTANHIGLSAA